MLNKLTVVYFLIPLLMSSLVKASLSCSALFIDKNNIYLEAEQQLEKRINSIDNKESFAELLMEVGNISQEQKANISKVAEVVFNELNQNQINHFVRNLLQVHQFIAQDSISKAIVDVLRNENNIGNYLYSDFAKLNVNPKKFLEWSILGKEFDNNQSFINVLESTIKSYKETRSAYIAKDIDVKQIKKDLLLELKKLNSPSLVGKFMEFFMQADAQTQLFILDRITVPIYKESSLIGYSLGNSRSSNSLNSYERALFLDSFFKFESLDELQEQAYFSYKPGNKNLSLLNNETTKDAALRFISKSDYDISNLDVFYAVQTLAKFEKFDRDIDTTLKKLLKVESGYPLVDSYHDTHINKLAQLELLILIRNAKGHSNLSIDLRYNKKQLSSKTDYTEYLISLFVNNSKHKIFDQNPELKEYVVEYFTNIDLDALRGHAQQKRILQIVDNLKNDK